MQTRRRFTKLAFRSVLGGSALFGALSSWTNWLWAATRKVLAAGTDRTSLLHEDPAALDTTNLEITPLEEFETMEPTNRVVDPAEWRLEVHRTGGAAPELHLRPAHGPAVHREKRPVDLPGRVRQSRPMERRSLQNILQQANFDRTASRIALEDKGGKSASYPIADVLSGAAQEAKGMYAKAS